MYNERGEERQRSYSLGETAAQRFTTPFNPPNTRQGFQSSGSVVHAPPTNEVSTPTSMQRQRSLNTTYTSAQAASGRASPALSLGSRRSLRTNSQRASARMPPPLSSTMSTGASTYGPPSLKNLDSYSSRNVAAALEPGADARQVDDVWQAVCVRVLPLFNGDGIRGHVEELNELVCTHVQKTFVRCQSSGLRPSQNPSTDLASLVTGLLIADLSELLRIGTITLAGKLSSLAQVDPLPDEQFLARLNEVWLFFWGSVLPNLEGVFWVLRCDNRLKAAVGGTQRDREREGRTEWGDGRIDVRKLALIEFRDHLVHPEVDRLAHLLLTTDSTRASSQRGGSGVATPRSQERGTTGGHAAKVSASSAATVTRGPPSRPQPPPRTPASIQAAARRRQMISVLASVLTGDERQAEIDGLLHLLRFNAAPGASSPIVERRQQRPAWDHQAHPSTWDTHPGFVGQGPSGGPMSTLAPRRRLTNVTRHSSDHTLMSDDNKSERERDRRAGDADEALRVALDASRRARAMTMDSVDTMGSGSATSGPDYLSANAVPAAATAGAVVNSRQNNATPGPNGMSSVASTTLSDVDTLASASAPSTIIGPSSATPTGPTAASTSQAGATTHHPHQQQHSQSRRLSGRSFLSRLSGRSAHHQQQQQQHHTDDEDSVGVGVEPMNGERPGSGTPASTMNGNGVGRTSSLRTSRDQGVES